MRITRGEALLLSIGGVILYGMAFAWWLTYNPAKDLIWPTMVILFAVFLMGISTGGELKE
jgi:hypothetical protein